MSVLTTKTARTIIYLGCLGGLLVINSVVVTTAWNTFVVDEQSDDRMNVLEGAGITAIAYVVLSAVRFAGKPDASMLESIRIRRERPASPPPEPSATDTMRERCSKLTQEQKDALKLELISRCGCTEQTDNAPIPKDTA